MPRNTIVLSGTPRERSMRAAEQLTPGMLVEWGNAANNVVSHIAAGGIVSPFMFVREQHENNGHGINDLIPNGDDCTVVFPTAGDTINAFTTDTISEGDRVASDGAGGVVIATSGKAIIGVSCGVSASLPGSAIMRCPIIIGSVQAE